MAIAALPTPPSRNDPANFSARADAFLAALPAFVTQANALAQEIANYSSAPTWVGITGKPTMVSSWINDAGYITTAALAGYVQTNSAPTFSGLVRARGGGVGLGQITTTNVSGQPAGMVAGDLVLVY